MDMDIDTKIVIDNLICLHPDHHQTPNSINQLLLNVKKQLEEEVNLTSNFGKKYIVFKSVGGESIFCPTKEDKKSPLLQIPASPVLHIKILDEMEGSNPLPEFSTGNIHLRNALASYLQNYQSKDDKPTLITVNNLISELACLLNPPVTSNPVTPANAIQSVTPANAIQSVTPDDSTQSSKCWSSLVQGIKYILSIIFCCWLCHRDDSLDNMEESTTSGNGADFYTRSDCQTR